MKKGAAAKSRKLCLTLLLAAAMFTATATAQAIEFKAKGSWLVGFGAGNGSLMSHYREPGNGPRLKADSNDIFEAGQRFRIQLDAVASENLSGTVGFEIGTQTWGKADQGGALGADATNVIKVKHAYLDWRVPEVDLAVRMGIQNVALPNVAGGSAIMDADAAAINAHYKINDNVGITAIWMRPVNDNFQGTYFYDDKHDSANYLDNMDLFAITVPVTLDGVEITPWAMYGMLGRNALRGLSSSNYDDPWETNDGILDLTIPGLTPGFNFAGKTPADGSHTHMTYGSMFWAGLPIAVTAWDPWNFELDLNYGYVQEMGRFDIIKRGDPLSITRGSTERQGWLAKALLEYKMDWGVPGILGWYSSGDDGSIRNGSERMPSIAGAGNFTSFIGDGNYGWGTFADNCDWAMTYSGTWGVGVQLRDMSFMENLSHTFRAVYWGGTNSPSMVKYMESASSWKEGYGGDGPYLTTNDGLLEFNLINSWQIYENLEANLELGYVFNLMDKDTWEKSGYYGGLGNGKFEREDAWKAQLIFAYNF